MRASRIALPVFVLLVLVCLSATSYGRTWNVPAEAATIQAGIDSASAGDTVLVACGAYFEHDITLKSGVLLTSAAGTWDCVTVDAERLSRAFEGTGLDSTTAVTGFTVKHGAGVDSGAGMYLGYADLAITNCCFDSCKAGMRGGGIDGAHGRLIRSLIDTDCEAGRHAVIWRGEDEAGRLVSAGVYFIRMEAGEFEDMKKVLLLRQVSSVSFQNFKMKTAKATVGSVLIIGISFS